MAHFDHEGDPTKEELLTYARLRDAGEYGGFPERAQNFAVDLCERYHGVQNPSNCTHALDAFSLALEGSDVNELL